MRRLSADPPWDVEAYDISRDGERLAYSFNEDGFSRVVLRPYAGLRLPRPTAESLPRIATRSYPGA